MLERRHSGARSQAANPESINTDPRNQWLGPAIHDSFPLGGALGKHVDARIKSGQGVLQIVSALISERSGVLATSEPKSHGSSPVVTARGGEAGHA